MATRTDFARLLDEAQRQGKPVEPLTSLEPGLSVADAYKIQDELVALRVSRGEKIVGYKMGLTSKAKMQQMGVSSPIMAILTDGMERPCGGTVELAGSIHPKGEPEIAFRLARDLRGKVSAQEALSACDGGCAAIDLLDSRYRDFKFTLPDVIADNASCFGFVLGPWHPAPSMDALSGLAMTLSLNGKVVSSGSSEAIYGHPAESLAALCALLDESGRFLKRGSVVLAGAASPAVALKACNRVEVAVESLGAAVFDVRS